MNVQKGTPEHQIPSSRVFVNMFLLPFPGLDRPSRLLKAQCRKCTVLLKRLRPEELAVKPMLPMPPLLKIPVSSPQPILSSSERDPLRLSPPALQPVPVITIDDDPESPPSPPIQDSYRCKPCPRSKKKDTLQASLKFCTVTVSKVPVSSAANSNSPDIVDLCSSDDE